MNANHSKIYLPFLGALLVLSLILYGQIIAAPFVYDDHEFIVNNPLAKSFAAICNNWQAINVKIVTYLTFMLNYQMSADQPALYHVTNIVLHIVNAWLVYVLVLLILRTPHLKKGEISPQGVAMLAAMLFLVHPIQTESVSYVWQRSELLNGMFYLLALCSYLQGRLKRQAGYYVGVAMCFVLGFYSKGMIISLPFMILLFEDAFFSVFGRRFLFLKVAGGLLLVAAGMFWLIPALHVDRSMILYQLVALTGSQIAHYHFFTQLDVVLRYILLLVFPFFQNVDHDIATHWYFNKPEVIGSAIVLVFILFLGAGLWRRHRLMSVGIFWFFIALFPSSFLGGRDPMVEHRLYFATGGFALCVAAGISLIKRRSMWMGVAVGVLVFLSLLTFLRNQVWRSEQTLFEDAVKKSPLKARPLMMLGTVYLTQNRFEDAVSLFRKVIRLDPKSAESYNNLGFIYLAHGQDMEAENYFEKAIAVRKDFAPAYVNLGYLALNMGDDDRAYELFVKSVGYGASSTGLVGLGNVYLYRRDFVRAESAFEQSLQMNPQNYKAYYSYGNLHMAQNKYSLALEKYQQALVLKPELPEALLALAQCYRRLQDPQTAEFYFNKAKIGSGPKGQKYMAR